MREAGQIEGEVELGCSCNRGLRPMGSSETEMDPQRYGSLRLGTEPLFTRTLNVPGGVILSMKFLPLRAMLVGRGLGGCVLSAGNTPGGRERETE